MVVGSGRRRASRVSAVAGCTGYRAGQRRARGVSAGKGGCVRRQPRLPAWQGGAEAAHRGVGRRGGRRGVGKVKMGGRRAADSAVGARTAVQAGNARAGWRALARRGRRRRRGSRHAVRACERLDLRGQVRGARGGPLQLLHHEPPGVRDVLRPAPRVNVTAASTHRRQGAHHDAHDPADL
jgi:hypothetical protein